MIISSIAHAQDYEWVELSSDERIRMNQEELIAIFKEHFKAIPYDAVILHNFIGMRNEEKFVWMYNTTTAEIDGNKFGRFDVCNYRIYNFDGKGNGFECIKSYGFWFTSPKNKPSN